MTLTADEFMPRFLLHVMPMGFHRIRHFGLIANNGRKVKLAVVRELLSEAASVAPSEVQAVDAVDEPVPRTLFAHTVCAQMVILETLLRAQTIRGPPFARGEP